MGAEQGKYDGFISYSHAVDGKLAPALQHALHTLAKPWYRMRALHIFRDETSLAANPALWGSIEKALAASRWFIYLASPRAAASEWVQREIEWWLSHREASSMLVVLTEGALEWDDTGAGFDWSVTNAFPRELAGKLTEEPLWVDLTWARGVENLSLRHSQFRAAVLKLAAPIHGRPPDELDGDDVRQHRRNRRTAQAAVVALVLLSIASMSAAYLAIRRNQESLSRELAVHSLQQLETDPELSVRLALHAVERAETQQAEEALRRALNESKVVLTARTPGALSLVEYSPNGQHIVMAGGAWVNVSQSDFQGGRSLPHPSPVTVVRFSADSSLVVTAAVDGFVRVWDVASGTLRRTIEASVKKTSEFDTFRRIEALAISDDGRRLVTAGGDSLDPNDSHVARVWDVGAGKIISELKGHTESIKGVAIDRAGQLVASGSFDDSVRVWAADTGAPRLIARANRRETFALAFTTDGSSLVGACEDGALLTWSLADGSVKNVTRIADAEKNGGVFGRRAWLSAGGERAIVRNSASTTVYDPITRRRLSDLVDFPSACGDVVFSRTKRLAACPATDGTATVWDVSTGQKLAQLRGHVGAVRQVDFSADERRLISAGVDGTARQWDVEQSASSLLLSKQGSRIERAVWSPDGQYAAAGTFEGQVLVWNARTGGPVAEVAAGGRINALAFASDSRRLLIGSFAEDGVRILDAQTGATLLALNTEGKTLAGSVGFSRDGLVAFAGLQDSPNSQTRSINPFLRQPAAESTAANKGLGWLLPRRHLARWDVATGRSLGAIDGDRGLSVAFVDFFSVGSPADLAWLPTDVEGTSRVWDLQSGRQVAELQGHMPSVAQPAMSPDGRLLALSDMEQVEIWDVTSRELKHVLLGPGMQPRPKTASTTRLNDLAKTQYWFTALAFDSTGGRLATVGQETIARVWDTSSGQLVRELRGHTHSLMVARFSSDGRLLVTAGQDARATVWRLDDGQAIATLTGHRDAVKDARFSADGQRVLTVGSDGVARIFDVSLARPLRELLAIASTRQTRQLSPDEARRFIH